MVIFWWENKLTLLYKLHTDYFSLCQSVILSVLSHEEIYLNICRNVRVYSLLWYTVYIYICIPWAGCDTRSVFEGSLNRCKFSFFLIGCHSMVKELCLPYNLLITGGTIIGYIPKVFALYEMQKALFRIWTRVSESISTKVIITPRAPSYINPINIYIYITTVYGCHYLTWCVCSWPNVV